MTRPRGSKNAPGKKPGPPKGGGRKETVKELDREIIARLLRRGYTYTKIERELPELGGTRLSRAMICIEAKTIREMYAAATVQHREALVAEQCAALDDVIAEAHEAWDVSKKEIEKWVRKTFGPRPCYKCKGKDCERCDGTGEVTPSAEEVFHKEGRVPGAEYMRIVIDSWKQKAQLQGLIGVGNVNIDARQQTVNMPQGFDWKMFFDPAKAGQPAEDDVEQKIKAVLDRPAPPINGEPK